MTEQRLFRVAFSGCCYVVAGDPGAARAIAERSLLEYGADDCGVHIDPDPQHVENLSQIDAEWRDTLPFGAHDDQSVEQILNSATTIPAPGPSYSASGTPPAVAE